ncbi:uncharacterized protein K452DRAFT_297512 [Aplosporella prunicola CBS 121167]|uniref:Cyanovirin-N domain-containing protein n=1 Tax=Aplosporella prunicola CBS 121167 TaxID=1176127 RepID=A0A6A6BFR0_9PEZI|nr:uncharacterized protein K452DRAFT_297512 [Aplosporella prunicola CBS 121167]KAF2143000.1 hypothetical protein K452DRAFT_297512 [Aplosporella prunicola CBS 121167]
MLLSHIVFFASAALATPLLPRGEQVVSGDEVTDTKCLDTSASLDTHETNVALLNICGGIAGSIQKCGGRPSATTGEEGRSRFDLQATEADAGAQINISKGRWERCVKAARLTCPTGTFMSTCVGGATSGDVQFMLSEA